MAKEGLELKPLASQVFGYFSPFNTIKSGSTTSDFEQNL